MCRLWHREDYMADLERWKQERHAAAQSKFNMEREHARVFERGRTTGRDVSWSLRLIADMLQHSSQEIARLDALLTQHAQKRQITAFPAATAEVSPVCASPSSSDPKPVSTAQPCAGAGTGQAGGCESEAIPDGDFLDTETQTLRHADAAASGRGTAARLRRRVRDQR